MWRTAQRYDLIAVKSYLMANNYRELKDNTNFKRGALWVITDRDRSYDRAFFRYLNDEFETNFLYARNGAGATCGRPAWFWVPGHEPGVWLGPGILED